MRAELYVSGVRVPLERLNCKELQIPLSGDLTVPATLIVDGEERQVILRVPVEAHQWLEIAGAT